MANLKITAYLSNSIAVSDNWSPSLEGLLTYRLLDEYNLLSANPTPEQVQESQDFIYQNLPLSLNTLNGESYWCCSSPCYVIKSEHVDRFRKRWDMHDTNLNWGKRKPQFKTSEGAEKSYDLPLYSRLASSLSWYCVGDKIGIQHLLESVTNIQKKRSYGNGDVREWTIDLIYSDYSLWYDDQLMKPIPVRLIDKSLPNPQLIWGWKSPAWLPTNKELCFMPTHNIIYANNIIS